MADLATRVTGPARLTCFKAYDVRGRVGRDLDPEVLYRIGRALAALTAPGPVVVGRDVRPHSPELADALMRGLADAGSPVVDLGLCGTEEVYDATAALGASAGAMVTASHNPVHDNGVKIVRRGAAPLSAEDLARLRALAEAGPGAVAEPAAVPGPAAPGRRSAYVERLLAIAAPAPGRPLPRLLANAGNGAAGPVFDAIVAALAARGVPLDVRRILHDPDPTFPNGVPNPMRPECLAVTAEATRAAGAGVGIAWDGDFDRCFLCDAAGAPLPGELLVAVLAGEMLRREPGAAIVHDTRVVFAIRDAIDRAGGRALPALSGHSRMKDALRRTGAVYGGEMSGHHYFRDFHACDSGMLPWLAVLARLGREGRGLAEIAAEGRARFPSSGEINFRPPDPDAAIGRVRALHEAAARRVDAFDGLSLEFADWRFNLRRSNTEDLVRLNIESRGDPDLVAEQAHRIGALLGGPVPD